MSSGKKASARHAFSLTEQLTEPSLNGVRTTPRHKRGSRSETTEPLSVGLCHTIYDEAKRQREELEHDSANSSLLKGLDLLAKSVKAALTRMESDEVDEEMEEDICGTTDFEMVSEEEQRAVDLFTTPSAFERPFGDVVFEKIEQIKKLQKKKKGESKVHGIDANIVKMYEGVGDLLSRYTTGKIPRALCFVPNLTNWEEVIYLTRPDKWSPHAYLAATKLFINCNPRMAQRYMNRILLPHLRQEIEEKQRLHLALYGALKHTCHKPGGFYKGIIIPLCRSGTCTVREAVIFSSVIKRTSLPVHHSAAALLCLAEMEYSGPTSFFIQTLLSKKYVMPFKALDGLVEHFMRFELEEHSLPAIWHQSLLTFVQSYKQHLKQEDLRDLRRLIKKHHHPQISPVLYKEIDAAMDTDDVMMAEAETKDMR